MTTASAGHAAIQSVPTDLLFFLQISKCMTSAGISASADAVQTSEPSRALVWYGYVVSSMQIHGSDNRNEDRDKCKMQYKTVSYIEQSDGWLVVFPLC